MTAEFMAVPQNLEAEQSVIGGLLLDDDNSERVQKVLAMLKPESFYSRPHQLIFAEMRQMFRDNKPVDGLTLFDALEGKGLADQVGGFAYLAEIAKNTPSAANIVAYAASVRELEVEKLRKELAADPEDDAPAPVAININVVDARVRDDSADA